MKLDYDEALFWQDICIALCRPGIIQDLDVDPERFAYMSSQVADGLVLALRERTAHSKPAEFDESSAED